MAYYTHTQDPIGCFTEKDVGNYFEYSDNPDSMAVCEDFPHIVWTGNTINDQGYRYAYVKKTVAYICIDEDEFGLPVIEKWNLKKNVKYSKQWLTL